MIRSFIAIEIPDEIREAFASVQEQLKQSRAGVRWVRASSIHLTLKFLGDIHPDLIDEIEATMAREIGNEPVLTLQPTGLGAFPNPRNPRVVWVGLQGEVERLGRLQSRLEAGLIPLGFAREKRGYSPHFTLGRVKHSRGRQELIHAMASLESVQFNSFDATEIILYKSDLRPTGAIYTKLRRIPLTAPISP
jgi:2'-5' RNA ligase